MKTKARPRYDIAALRDLAGDKVFARGEAYHHAGQVEILSLEPGRVLAQVAGTDPVSLARDLFAREMKDEKAAGADRAPAWR